MKDSIQRFYDDIFYYFDLGGDLDDVEEEVLVDAINQALPSHMAETIFLLYGLCDSKPMAIDSVAKALGKSITTIKNHYNKASVLLTQEVVKVVFMDKANVQIMIPRVMDQAECEIISLSDKMRSLRSSYDGLPRHSRELDQAGVDIEKRFKKVTNAFNSIVTDSKYASKFTRNPASIIVPLFKVISRCSDLSDDVIDLHNRVSYRVARTRRMRCGFYAHTGTYSFHRGTSGGGGKNEIEDN